MALAGRPLLLVALVSAVVLSMGMRSGALPRAAVVAAAQSAAAGNIAADTFNVRSLPFNAVGNGVADDTAAIQGAIDAASKSGGTVYFPPGSYRTTRELTVRAPNVSLRGAGATLSTIRIAASAKIGLTFDIPRLANRIALASDLGIGMRTVSVAKGAGKTLHPGSWLFMEDRAPYAGSFMTRMAAVSGDEVTLEEASPVAITAAQEGAAYGYMPLLEGIAIRDLGFESAEGASSPHATLVMLSRTHRALVEDCLFRKSTGALLTLRDSRGAMVWRSVFEEAASVTGDGVEGLQCTSCSVSNCEFRLCPFGVVFSQSPHAEVAHNTITARGADEVKGRGIKVQNGSGFSRVVDNTISDTGLFGIYSSDSWDVLISGNTLLGTGTGPLEHGIQIGGFLDSASARNVVSNNVLEHVSGDGIAIVPTDGRNKQLFNVATGNEIHSVGGSAIQFVGSRNLASGNVVSDYGASGIRADPGTSANLIVGNQIGSDERGVGVDIDNGGQQVGVGNLDRGSAPSAAAQSHEILQLHGAGTIFKTGDGDAQAGMALFPGTAKYPSGARFTLYVLLQTENGTGVYQLRNPAGQPVGTLLSTTSREPAILSVSLPAGQLPAGTSFFEERLGARGGTATLSAAFILIEW